ncbi:MAG TPA: hypothetical protein VLW50_29300 [Streptosporangiaceae bacterium]|nr:hypothetical protein [Streptosporangiaceae bacterium]
MTFVSHPSTARFLVARGARLVLASGPVCLPVKRRAMDVAGFATVGAGLIMAALSFAGPPELNGFFSNERGPRLRFFVKSPENVHGDDRRWAGGGHRCGEAAARLLRRRRRRVCECWNRCRPWR